MISSLYIHIPFCKNICSYCDFCKVYYNDALVDRYLDTLEREISIKYKGDILKTIYIGGGTPSSLNIRQLEKLFNILSVLNKDKDIEFTIECNFDSIDKEKLLLFKKYGINRISFGIETTDSNILKYINRTINKNYVIDIINYCKEIGLNNINVDLMYGFSDDLDILNRDLDFILSLDVSHISTYSLIISPNTIFYINGVKNIDEDVDYSMYNIICNRLEKSGYIHYEISNFGKDGYRSRHNLCYWKNENYYGFGLGASSYINNIRSINTKSINKYLDGCYDYEWEILENNNIIDYEMILGLRLKEGIDLHNFEKKYGLIPKDIYNYDDFIENGCIIESDNNLYVPEDKWYVINSILTRFLR